MGKEQRPAEVEKGRGSLFSVSSDLTVTRHLRQVDISNGLDWSLDQKTFFYIDSLSLSVDAFDYDLETGDIGKYFIVLPSTLHYDLETGDISKYFIVQPSTLYYDLKT
ncbi:regucalcin-like [Etheostoma cragini]|uniref:regucalcin-like n=1 Tax=Etheostoma cragini TaxID=417921 RepID=UPI00155E6738|nr:regucalcin-like [Etheostoma cragini]